jgi:hypothetical protein
MAVTEQFGADESDSDAHAIGSAALMGEALRLVSAMQDWAQGWPQRNPGEADERRGGTECQWCPLCQFVAVLRGQRPEVTERVAEAGTAAAAALRALVEAAVSAGGAATQHRAPRPGPGPRVQKIDLGDEA